MQRPSDERLGQEDALGSLPEPRHRPGGITIEHNIIIALVLFVALGTLVVYVGFHILPAPSSTTMNAAMPGMTSSQMESMSTSASHKMDSMPGMAADNSRTLQKVRGYFRDHLGRQPYFSMITGYTVDHASLSIQTNIYGLDPVARRSGQQICSYASQLLKDGGTAIERFDVWNHSGDKLCGSEP